MSSALLFVHISTTHPDGSTFAIAAAPLSSSKLARKVTQSLLSFGAGEPLFRPLVFALDWPGRTAHFYSVDLPGTKWAFTSLVNWKAIGVALSLRAPAMGVLEHVAEPPTRGISSQEDIALLKSDVQKSIRRGAIDDAVRAARKLARVNLVRTRSIIQSSKTSFPSGRAIEADAHHPSGRHASA